MPQTEEEKLNLEKMRLENRMMREKIVKGYIKDLGIPILAILFGISIIANGGHITLKILDNGEFNPSVAIEAAGEEALDKEMAEVELDEVIVEGIGSDGSGIIKRPTPRLMSKTKIKKKIRVHKKYVHSDEQMSMSHKTVSKVNYTGFVFSILCLIGIYFIIKWKKKGVL